ncbi:cutinase family protein [Nocardia terpenica]|uniref:Cutinase family protein n=2 Tax=Nocardia terpenica TaxID=455432 RepID=A0A6G9ZEE0_9NOCA|nr:cutinase family protein [Nocardia terpenica]
MAGIRGMAIAVVSLIVTIGASGVAQADPGIPVQGCPHLYVLGVQGTGQSSPQSPLTGTDSGMLGAVLGPLRAVEHLAGHAYVPYEAGFGGAVPGGAVPYAASIGGGLDRLRSMAATLVARCPRTELALLGYSQGAHIVSMLAQQIGNGSTAIPADRVAAVALLADPTRGRDESVFPGAPDRTAPAPAPGTIGTEVSRLHADPRRIPDGEGIGPERDITTDFGVLTGRVASFCLPGDLACDAPRMPLLRVLVNIAGQVELNPADPMAALTSIQQAIQTTAAKTATEIVDHDLRGTTLGTLSLAPGYTLSQRLAEASDPRETPDVRQAELKIGTSALNSLLALTGRMLTPADVAEIAALGSANPSAALTLLGEKFVTAGHQRLPRGAVFHLITDLFDALAQLSDDTGQLLDLGIWSKYFDTVRQHGAYLDTAFTTSGQPATEFITDWFTALASDLAAHRIPPPAAPVPAPPLPAPQSAPSALPPAIPPADTPPRPTPTPAPASHQPADARDNPRPTAATHRFDREFAWIFIVAGLAAIAYTATRPRRAAQNSLPDRSKEHE